VILFGSDYWQGLRQWIHDRLLEEGKIAAEDLELLHTLDDPQEACEVIQAFNERKLQEQAVPASDRNRSSTR
jgi:predicted Rossmann-fold nucleotide-binding protein